jgi:hypothetical protein
VDKIMSDPTQMEAVLLKESVACLVTNAEHSRLSNKLAGFERYAAAGIRVWDVRNDCWKVSEPGA